MCSLHIYMRLYFIFQGNFRVTKVRFLDSFFFPLGWKLSVVLIGISLKACGPEDAFEAALASCASSFGKHCSYAFPVSSLDYLFEFLRLPYIF